MTKSLFIVSVMLALSVCRAGAEMKQTVSIANGATVDGFVKGITFDGDAAILAMEDGETLTVDELEDLSLAFDYNGAGIDNAKADDRQAKQLIYTVDGTYKGNSTQSLKKGVYIINGKKTILQQTELQ